MIPENSYTAEPLPKAFVRPLSTFQSAAWFVL